MAAVRHAGKLDEVDSLKGRLLAQGFSADEISYYTWLDEQGSCWLFCHDAALLNKVEPRHIDPFHMKPGANGRLVADQDFVIVNSEGFFINQSDKLLKTLQPRDVLTYFDAKGLPIHSNRFLGFEDGVPNFLDKWGNSPLAMRSWNEVSGFPEYARRVHGYDTFDMPDIHRIVVFRPQ